MVQILGILSPLCCGCLTGLPAVILGHMGLGAVGDESGPLKGRGFAITGLVLGYLGIILTAIGIVFQMMSGDIQELLQQR